MEENSGMWLCLDGSVYLSLIHISEITKAGGDSKLVVGTNKDRI